MADQERISLDEVNKVARLARLALGDDELVRMRGELDAILDSMAALTRLDVTGVPPTTLVLERGTPLRPDAPRNGLSREEALRAAARSEAGAFAVPKVMEGT
jgi:aspartyl-tRNA(Asn)/glutamyl-tRNA(Gln) amidotransferase subunit C